jgi:hypothetical protein
MRPRRLCDRRQAGRLLAEQLRAYAGRDDVVVLALLRGGVHRHGDRGVGLGRRRLPV